MKIDAYDLKINSFVTSFPQKAMSNKMVSTKCASGFCQTLGDPSCNTYAVCMDRI